MSDFFRKGMLMGVGLLSLSREKAEEFMDELVRRGEMTEKEGRETVEELLKKSKEMKTDVAEKVDEALSEALKSMNLVTKDDLKKLEKRITALEKAVKSGD